MVWVPGGWFWMGSEEAMGVDRVPNSGPVHRVWVDGFWMDATEVTNAVVTARNGIERVQAAQAARELAERQLNAENEKFAVGMSTNYLVIQAQRDLATAQNNELQAILNYRNSLVELDRLQQTTLQNLNVTLVGSKDLPGRTVADMQVPLMQGRGVIAPWFFRPIPAYTKKERS